MPLSRRSALTAPIACALAAPWPAARAQAYPSRTIRIVVGAPAGGVTDTLARALAEPLARALSVPVVVDNRPGASGVLGMQELLKAPRDGHTLMVGVSGLAAEVPLATRLPFDPLQALLPLVDLGHTGLVLVTAGAPRFDSFDAFCAHLRSRSGRDAFASYSAGTVSHTLGVALARLAGADLVHVGYRGSPLALQDTAAGRVAYLFDSPAGALPLIRSGQLQALGITAPRRLPALPRVPTFAELGHPALTQMPWLALWSTPDTPAEVRERVRHEAREAMRSARMQALLGELHLEPGRDAPPADLVAVLRADAARQAARLREIGFQPE